MDRVQAFPSKLLRILRTEDNEGYHFRGQIHGPNHKEQSDAGFGHGIFLDCTGKSVHDLRSRLGKENETKNRVT